MVGVENWPVTATGRFACSWSIAWWKGDYLDPEIVPDWWFVAIDETQDWCLPEKQWVDKIHTSYLFDRNRHVHCCELTASYEMWPLDYHITWQGDPPEDVREQIEQMVQACRADFQVRYQHVDGVEVWMAKHGIKVGQPSPKATCTYGDDRQHTMFVHYGKLVTPDDPLTYEQAVKYLEEWQAGQGLFA